MKKDMCNDKVEYDARFAIDGVIRPIGRGEILVQELKSRADEGDACYYTTPNLVSRNQYCTNPEEPEFTMSAQTE
jgi:hypothetical protein